MRCADPDLDAGPTADASTLTFRFADPGHRLAGVRLHQEARVPGDRLAFGRTDDGWALRLPRPAVDRMEYLLELAHPGGGTETVTDPANPLLARGAFGDKSVLLMPGYEPPRWLDDDPPPGSSRDLSVAARALRLDVQARLWSPAGVDPDVALPLLVVHDGPEYAELAGLTAYLSSRVDGGELPPVRAALLSPGPRDEWYAANGAYTRALGLAIVPRLREEVPTTAVVGMGASLGALAVLHAQRRRAGTFDAMFLQSGSFFHPRHDAHERRFPHYHRIVRAVDEVLRAGGHRSPVPTVLTCGGIEENIENNRVMARALAAQGYPTELHEVRDTHNYTAWRDAFDPHLTGLLQQLSR